MVASKQEFLTKKNLAFTTRGVLKPRQNKGSGNVEPLRVPIRR
jgi:hypothetical protein